MTLIIYDSNKEYYAGDDFLAFSSVIGKSFLVGSEHRPVSSDRIIDDRRYVRLSDKSIISEPSFL